MTIVALPAIACGAEPAAGSAHVKQRDSATQATVVARGPKRPREAMPQRLPSSAIGAPSCSRLPSVTGRFGSVNAGALGSRPMRRSSAVLAFSFLAALGLAANAGARPPSEPPARKTTIVVHGEAEFAAAVKYFRYSRGRIVLRPYLYRQLVVGPRSRQPLRIVGTRGARVERMLFAGAQRVSFGRVTLGPIRGDALSRSTTRATSSCTTSSSAPAGRVARLRSSSPRRAASRSAAATSCTAATARASSRTA